MNWFQAWWERTFHAGHPMPDNNPVLYPSPDPVVNPVVPVPVPLEPVAWPTSDAATVLAATAWMEDRSGEKEGMQAVMNVVLNRVAYPRWWGNSIYTVCMKPKQFSCWNAGSSQLADFQEMLAKDPGDAQWAIARNLATVAVSGVLPDMTDHADSYYSATDPALMRRPPAWINDAVYCGDFGGNKFYRLYLPPYAPNPVS